jgi:hypothetical protein
MNRYYNSSVFNLMKYVNLNPKKDVSIQTEDMVSQNLDTLTDNCLQISLDESLNILYENKNNEEMVVPTTDDNPYNMPRIIGITGKKFNGKDTLGIYLSKYGYQRMAFADPLKEVIKNIFNFNDAQLYGEDKERIDENWKISPRSAMQFIGTDLFRHQMNKLMPDIGNEIWIKVIKRQIEDIWKQNPNQKIVLTDLRFPNEINLIKELNGIIIRVKRKIDDTYSSIDNDFIVVHESETYIDVLEVDYDFDNNKTKTDLYKQFDNLYIIE